MSENITQIMYLRKMYEQLKRIANYIENMDKIEIYVKDLKEVKDRDE